MKKSTKTVNSHRFMMDKWWLTWKMWMLILKRMFCMQDTINHIISNLILFKTKSYQLIRYPTLSTIYMSITMRVTMTLKKGKYKWLKLIKSCSNILWRQVSSQENRYLHYKCNPVTSKSKKRKRRSVIRMRNRIYRRINMICMIL